MRKKFIPHCILRIKWINLRLPTKDDGIPFGMALSIGMWFWLLLVSWFLGWCCIPDLLLLNKRPTATLAWLWALVLFPVVGPLLYLAIGSERVKRRRMRRRHAFRGHQQRTSARAHAVIWWNAHSKKNDFEPSVRSLFESVSSITQLPVATVRNLEVLRKAPAFYDALQEDIKKAKTEIHVETYIWRDDEVGKEFLNLLIEAAIRGVVVRVLIDELGSFWLKESYFQPLVQVGGQFSWCHTLSPLRNRYSFNLRNHRKLQIIDGQVAYVGGMNFGREYLGRDPVYGDWADVQIRVEGTVIEVFQEIFAEDWFFATGKDDIRHIPNGKRAVEEKTLVQVLQGGPDEEDQPMLRVNLALVETANERLWIAAGYFVPGEIMQAALQVAASRGIDIRILISQQSEHPLLVKAGRSYYEALLRRGIKIFEYSKGIEHSKYIIIDDGWVSVGSSNLDERSMRLNFELNLLVRCEKTNHQFAQIFKKTIAESVEIDLKTFSKRAYREKLIESALRPLSPIL
jgi:cardiolipin synthase A/B